MSVRTRHIRLVEIAYVPSAEDDLTDLLTEEALNDFELEVAEHPDRWPVIPGTGSVRKARAAMRGRGKSGGARICYVHDGPRSKIWVIAAYGKSTKASLTKAERQLLKKLAGKLLA